MSYMMTVAGTLPAESFAPIEFLPASQSQKYIADLEAELAAADGSPLWFVHDGRSGTSHDLIVELPDHYFQHETIDGMLLFRLMEALAQTGSVFRIWYASGQPDCHRILARFESFSELRSGVVKMVVEGRDISLRFEAGAQSSAK